MAEKFDYSKQLSKDYLEARSKFLTQANRMPELMGNDNIIGRIGEFIAFLYLNENGRSPVINTNHTQKGHDILCGEIKVQVKMITFESKSKRSTKIGVDWDEFILIELGPNSVVSKIGHITREEFNDYRIWYSKEKNKNYSDNPYASLTMFREDGVFGINGGKIMSGEKGVLHKVCH